MNMFFSLSGPTVLPRVTLRAECLQVVQRVPSPLALVLFVMGRSAGLHKLPTLYATAPVPRIDCSVKSDQLLAMEPCGFMFRKLPHSKIEF